MATLLLGFTGLCSTTYLHGWIRDGKLVDEKVKQLREELLAIEQKLEIERQARE